MPSPFPKVGISLSYILDGKFYSDNSIFKSNLSSWTTKKVCEYVIKPKTQSHACSYCDLLMMGEEGSTGTSPYVGPAEIFISHAHDCLFLDLVDAITNHLKSPAQEEHSRCGDIFLWLDIFSINQHEPQDWTFDWLSSTFQTAIRDMGRTVMVMSPWDQPKAFQRAWCIFEAFCTINTKSSFELAMSQTQRQDFLKALSRHDEIQGSVDKMLATIRSRKSKSKYESDRKQIFAAIEKETSSNIYEITGFAKIDELVWEQYRAWILNVSIDELQALEARRSQKFQGFDDLEYCDLLLATGVLCEKQGKFEDAERYIRESMSVYETHLVPDHPDSLRAMNALARVYDTQNNFDKAEDLYLKCLDKRIAELGPQDRMTLQTMSNLGLLYLNQGKINDAKKISKRCLRIQREELGNADTDTLSSELILATVYFKDGSFGSAERHCGYCLKSRKNILGDDHPETLNALNLMAGLSFKVGWIKDSFEVYKTIYQTTRSSLGEDHIETLRSLHNLALAMKGLEDQQSTPEGQQSAEHLFLECLVQQKRYLVEHHNDTLTTNFNLGLLYKDRGLELQARHHLEESLAGRIRTLGVENPETMETFRILRLLDEKLSYKTNNQVNDFDRKTQGSEIENKRDNSKLRWKDTQEATAGDYSIGNVGGDLRNVAKSPVAKCFCGWNNCYQYQKAFHRYAHGGIFDGAVKIIFEKSSPTSLSLKSRIDEILRVGLVERNDWTYRSSERTGNGFARYYIARHHFKESHLRRYLSRKASWDWAQPLVKKDAINLLYAIDSQYEFSEGEEPCYIQVPNVPKQVVKYQAMNLKEGQRRMASLIETERRQLIEELKECKSFLSEIHRSVTDLKLKIGNKRNECSQMSDKDTPCPLLSSSDSSSESSEGTCDMGHTLRAPRRRNSDHSQSRAYKRRDSWNTSSDDISISSQLSIGSKTISSRASRSSQTSQQLSLRRDSEIFLKRVDSITVTSRTSRSSTRSVCSFMSRQHSASSQSTNRLSVASIQSPEDSVLAIPRRRRSMVVKDGHEARENKTRDFQATPPQGLLAQHNPGADRTLYTDSDEDATEYVEKKEVFAPPGLADSLPGLYTGSFSVEENVPHGKGRLTIEDYYYEGYWTLGSLDGFGSVSDREGFYEGRFKNNQRNGWGVMNYNDGGVFEGLFLSNIMSKGTLTFPDGTQFRGSFKEGKCDGKGIWKFTDNSIYEGEFKDGDFHGKGTLFWSDGAWYEGDWHEGLRHGEGREFRPNRSLRFAGTWQHGYRI